MIKTRFRASFLRGDPVTKRDYVRTARSTVDSPLASARIAAGLTQAQLAEKVGVSSATVRSWELGSVRIRQKYLLALRDAIGYVPQATDENVSSSRMRIGSLIRQRREALDLSVDALASALCVSPGTIAKWESGDTIPLPGTLSRIADVLHCTPEDIGGKSRMEGSPRIEAMRRMRTDAGLSYRELSRRTGISDTYISQIERNAISIPTDETLSRIAAACGARPEDYGIDLKDVQAEQKEPACYPFSDFGAALTALRERAGLKRGEVASRLGVTLPCYAGYELGKTLPPPKRLNDIAAVLGVPCSDLAALDGYQSRAKAAPGGKARFPRFGGYIRACREREGFTLRGAAERLGIHYVTLSQYELGAALPRQKTTRAIADLLHEPADRLLAMREDAEGADSVRITEAGRRVADLRKQAGLTQRQLADACGLNISTVACMERGKSNPANAPDTVKKLAAFLGVPESYIVGGCKKDRGTGIAHHRADLTGKRFSMLLVTGMAYVKDCTVYWNCRCDCGNSTIVPTERLTVGKTKSCGCLKASGVRARETLQQTIRPYLVDGTNIRAHERTQPNRDNATTGIRGVCYRASHKTYIAYMGFKGSTYRKAFKNLDDAVEYRKSLENTLSKPAVEAFYAERNEHHDEQS